jgi:hypothetical protein
MSAESDATNGPSGAEITEVCRRYEETVQEVNSNLASFVRRHPSFRDRVGLYISGSEPDLEVRGEVLDFGHRDDFYSEWQALVAFGYKKACDEFLTDLDREADGLDLDP